MIMRGWLFPMVLALLSTLCLTPARANDAPVFGGPGGRNFNINCPPGQFLLGVGLRSGNLVDAVRAHCMALQGHQFGGTPWHSGFTGGSGGSLQQNGCSAERYVAAIKIGFTRDENRPQFLDYIELECAVIEGYGGETKVCLHTGQGCWDRHPNPGPYNGWGLSFQSRCPAGQAATGLHGRSGNYVDAIGLICGPRPVVTAGTTPGPAPAPGLSAEMQSILNEHNAHRARHCVGNLTWSQAVANSAQLWVNGCHMSGSIFQHENQHTYGENLAWGGGLTPKGAADFWYNEINNYNFNAPVYTTNPQVGHFTQMVWRTSTQLGCAKMTCGAQILWACRYAPPGNINVVVGGSVTPAIAQKSLSDNVLRPCR